MHFQKTHTFTITLTLVLVLFLSGLLNPIPTKAASPSDDVYRIMDSLLNSTGLSANYSYVNRMTSTLANIVRGTGQSYKNYCKENQLEENQESWQSYMNSEAYLDNSVPFADTFATAFGVTLFGANLIEWFIDMNEEDIANLSDEDAARLVLTDGEPVVKGGSYTISDETVEATRAVFDEMVTATLPYFYIKSVTWKDFSPTMFSTKEKYDQFVSFANTCEQPVFIQVQASGLTYDTLTNLYLLMYQYNTSLPLVIPDFRGFNNYCYMYSFNDNWQFEKWQVMNEKIYLNTDMFNSYSEYLEYFNTHETSTWSNNCHFWRYSGNIGMGWQWLTNDGRKIKIYTDVDYLKKMTVGYQDVYFDVTYDYSTSNDNSVKFSGSYMVDDSYSYSHDQIVNNIDNSSETVDESVVNNIVGDTINNITNNYYTESSGTGSAGSGGSDNSGTSSGSTDDGKTIWDGLTTLVDGIGDLLNFFVTLIGEVLSLLGNLLTQILQLIGSFAGISGEFVYFMDEFFVFVPDEVWGVIELGITAMIGIAVWKAFKS